MTALLYPTGQLTEHPPLRTQDGVIRDLVRDGKWTREQGIAFLMEIGVSPALAVERVNVIALKLDNQVEHECRIVEANEAMGASRETIERVKKLPGDKA